MLPDGKMGWCPMGIPGRCAICFVKIAVSLQAPEQDSST